MTDEQISALKEPGGKSQDGLFTPEEQIIELALAIATANWTTRINDGLQVPFD